MSFTEREPDATEQTFPFKTSLKKILTAASKYAQMLCWNNDASKARTAGQGWYLWLQSPLGSLQPRRSSAPHCSIYWCVGQGSCAPPPPAAWEAGSQMLFLGILDQPVRLFSRCGDWRYLARDITLLPSSPTWLSRRLHPSSRLGAEITFQPFKSWDYATKDLWMTQFSNHN